MINGSKWWKCDFHVHTPASEDYLESDIDKSPREFLQNAMDKRLDCLVISDHNNADWVDDLAEEYQKMETENKDNFRKIFIFPGVELEVYPSIHLLAIFDLNTPSENIKKIIAQIRKDSDPLKFVEAVSVIEQYNGIALPAHVDAPKGLFYNLKEGFGSSLESIIVNTNLLAVEVINKDYSLPQLCKNYKISYTKVVGSDSHCFNSIGEKFTWVKMESPCIDALRLALHDEDDGVKRFDDYIGDPNDITNRYYIESITVNNAYVAGRKKSLSIPFSPWLSTIIGGRGSGKSSVIEFLRLALNNKNMPEDIKASFNDFAKINDKSDHNGMLLEDTVIEVIIVKDAQKIKIIYQNNEIKEYVFIGTDWQPREAIGIIENRYPVDIFSQKQIYEMAENPNSVLEYIDRQFDKEEWSRELKSLQNSWLLSKMKINELNGKIKDINIYQAELTDLNTKLQLIESAAQKTELRSYKEYSDKKDKIFYEIATIKNLIKKVRTDAWEYNLNNTDILDDIFDNETSEKYKAIVAEWADMVSLYMTFQEGITKIYHGLEDFEEHITLSDTYQAIQNSYTQIIEELHKRGISGIDNYPTFLHSKSNCEDKIKILGELKSKLDEETKLSQQYLEKIYEYERQLRENREKVIDNLNSDDLKISLIPLSDMHSFENKFRDIIRKSTEFKSDILDLDENRGFIYEFYNSKGNKWENLTQQKKKVLDLIGKESDDHFSRRFVSHINFLRNNDIEDIYKILLLFPEDTIKIEIKIGNKFKDISIGSAGQKTAGLLSMLLHSNKCPLIIDQPEDDLDTKLISDLIVKSLKRIKEKQQIIIITHNPNIPVNGAAEQIIVMEFNNGLIQCKNCGALQKCDIRHEICDIMEGGDDALKNRYFRIFKALN